MVGNTSAGERRSDRHGEHGLLAGLVLVGIGVVLLAVQLLNSTLVGAAAPLVIGLVFLAAWLRSNGVGYLIPGGILTGLGVGVILAAGPLANAAETITGAVAVAGLAGGFLLISLGSLLRRNCFMWWPLIPGGLLALVSVAMATGERGLAILSLLNYAWPLALLAGGGYILYMASRRN